MNACALVNLNGSAGELLRIMHEVEAEFGRERETRWGSRTLDLDLIAAGNTVLPDAQTHNHWLHLSPEAQRTETPSELILPHPRLQDRAFVLVPLADVAPDWVHPTLGLSVLEMRDKLPHDLCAEVVPVSG
jgi:2-amino-4-hydroxy-6-hydroxymethyldihydropteridine diphosphokinase